MSIWHINKFMTDSTSDALDRAQKQVKKGHAQINGFKLGYKKELYSYREWYWLLQYSTREWAPLQSPRLVNVSAMPPPICREKDAW